MKQRTVVIIFPKGARRTSVVVDVKLRMANEGLRATEIRKRKLSVEEIEGLFPELVNTPGFPKFVKELRSDKSIILVYWEQDAIARALQVLEGHEVNDSTSTVHASRDQGAFEREYKLLFPDRRW